MLRHLGLILVLASVLTGGIAFAASSHHVNTTLQPANGSTVNGRVELTALPKGGTLITVVARGLQPGTSYVSLYYDNGVCDLEPYSADDVIGHTADVNGEATLNAKVADDLDEIHSVSVRLDPDFTLEGCAAVNP